MGLRMFKRRHRDSNKETEARGLIKAAMMFMGIGGKGMTDLELLNREEHDLLSPQMMCHHQQNSLRGSGPRGSGGPLTL